MRELLRNFQSNCIAVGPDRNVLLRKLVAAGIAYAVPVPCGEGDQYRIAYEKVAMIPAMKVISEVNEVMLLGNTDEVLNDVRTLWESQSKPPMDCPATKSVANTSGSNLLPCFTCSSHIS